MESTPAELRHSIRGTLNALKLCVSAFEMPLETSEKLEFLSDIESATDKLVELLDRFEVLTPGNDSPPAGEERRVEGPLDVRVGVHVR
jgi:hypothetical protein